MPSQGEKTDRHSLSLTKGYLWSPPTMPPFDPAPSELEQNKQKLHHLFYFMKRSTSGSTL